MAKITNIDDFLKQLREEHTDVVFCPELHSIVQKGQTCKLVAGAVVQHYLYESNQHTQEPLPLYKEKQYDYSLRQRAKEVLGSQAGEVYGPEQVKNVLSYDGFTAHCYRIQDETTYQQFILDLVSRKQPVIAYFDVNITLSTTREGMPDIFSGMCEHAAVISGYYFDKDGAMQLIYCQWGNFYTASLHDMFASAQQLSADKQPETFYKFAVPGYKSKPTWINPTQTAHGLDLIYGDKSIMRVAAGAYVGFCRLFHSDKRVSQPPQQLEGSLVGVVCVIEGDKRALDILDTYQHYDCFSDDDKEATLRIAKISKI